jgi:hypothetical protein
VAHVAVAVGEVVCSAIGVTVGGCSIGVTAVRISICRVSIGRRLTRVSTEILSTLRGTITTTTPHAALLCMLHLRLVAVFVILVMAQEGQEVHIEAEDVEAVEECYGPLEHRRNVPNVLQGAHAKGDAHADLDDDEGELDPEGDAQDGVLAVVDSQALVLPTDKNCGHNVAEDEDAEEDVMQLGMPPGVKDGKKDQTGCADDGGDSRACGVDFLPVGGVLCELAGVSEVTLKDECEVECHDCGCRQCNEHWLQKVRANIYMVSASPLRDFLQVISYQRYREYVGRSPPTRTWASPSRPSIPTS